MQWPPLLWHIRPRRREAMTAPANQPLCEDCKRHMNIEHDAVLPGGERVYWTGCFCEAPDRVHDHWEAMGSAPLPRLAILEVEGEPIPKPEQAAIVRAVKAQAIADELEEAALSGNLREALDNLSDTDYALVEASLPAEYRRDGSTGREADGGLAERLYEGGAS